jgi:hypothetical protein
VTRSARPAVLALAALWLALGLANVWRGVDQPGGRYKFWAFQHHCYSDVLALYGDRYQGGGRPVPYLEDRIEYPVLLGVALWLPAFAPGGAAGHLAVTALLLAAALLVTLLALERLPGAAPWWLAATPALAYYAFLTWDLLPIALLAVALLALERGRPGAAGVAAAAGAAAKLFPVALLPPALGALSAGPRRALLLFAGAAALLLLALNLPVALLAFDGWAWFFRYNAGRGAENSVWHALGLARGPLLDLVSLGPVALTALAAAAAARRVGQAGRPGHDPSQAGQAGQAGQAARAARAARLGTALVLVVWIAVNKVWSPQYALYGFLAGALAAGPGWLFAALSLGAVADFHLEFELRARRWDPWFLETLVKPSELLRTALWLTLAWWIGRALWREARPSNPWTR